MQFRNNKINETMVILIIKVKSFPISKKLYKLCKTGDCNDEILHHLNSFVVSYP